MVKDSRWLRYLFAALLACPLWGQAGAMRQNVEIAGGGVFPLSGYLADEYSAGPAGRAGYEFQPLRILGAEAGFTEGGLPATACSRFGCEHPRQTLKLLDYGLRAHLLLDDGRLDLSAGVGGGYVWHEQESYFTNASLFQYSGKAALALDRAGRFRMAFTVRTWRDLGRPTQQWLSAMVGLSFGFGGHP